MREAHILEPSKKTSTPRRMIFFDSESRVDVEITDEEIQRALSFQAGEQDARPVRKDHDPYLVCATFYRDRRRERGKLSLINKDYYPLTQSDFLEQFWQDVDRFTPYNEKLFMFAHNAKYDVQVTCCIPLLVRMGYRVTSFSDSNPFILKLEKHHEACTCPSCFSSIPSDGNESQQNRVKRNKTIVILSSTNYFAQPVKSLGKIFHLPKLDFDHDQEILPHDRAFMDKAIEYGRRDVEIIERAMLHFMAFVEREDLGKFAMTVAGQAFAAFRQKFLKTKIFIHSDQRALDVERRAYAGGRNECFRVGEVKGRVFYVDINSMYPFVMKNHKYPVKLITFWEQCSLKQLKQKIDEGYLICCDAKVNTVEPIFHLKRKKLIFPSDNFRTSLTTPELIEAYERGILEEVSNVCIYEAGDIFSPYVDYFYNARLEAKEAEDAVHDHLYKIFLNALYGKFGQKNIKWEKIGEADPEFVGTDMVMSESTGKPTLIKIFGGAIFEKYERADDLEAFNSFPAIAAHVTAHARMLLWSYIEMAGRQNVNYCDTDSLMVNGWGYQLLYLNDAIDKSRLGALKLELITVEDGLLLHGAKDYAITYPNLPGTGAYDKKRPIGDIQTDIKIKGIPKSAVPIEPTKDGRLRFAMTKWGGFSDRLRAGSFDKYHNNVIIKTLKREYNKGTINDDGSVSPFRLDVDQEAREQLQREMEMWKREIAAGIEATDRDYIKSLCQEHGYIRTPKKGERYYTEYTEFLPRKVKGKYFRIDKGMRIDDWCAATGYEINDLWEDLKS